MFSVEWAGRPVRDSLSRAQRRNRAGGSHEYEPRRAGRTTTSVLVRAQSARARSIRTLPQEHSPRRLSFHARGWPTRPGHGLFSIGRGAHLRAPPPPYCTPPLITSPRAACHAWSTALVDRRTARRARLDSLPKCVNGVTWPCGCKRVKTLHHFHAGCHQWPGVQKRHQICGAASVSGFTCVIAIAHRWSRRCSEQRESYQTA
jgi:hypothetical protein